MFNRFFISISILLCICCSKSDDDASDVDPVYTLEYKKLQEIEQITRKTSYYAGIKVGDKKTSLLIPDSKSCRAEEFFGPLKDSSFPALDFAYIKFEEG